MSKSLLPRAPVLLESSAPPALLRRPAPVRQRASAAGSGPGVLPLTCATLLPFAARRTRGTCSGVRRGSRGARRVAMAWQRPMAGKDLPEPLRASDGLRSEAAPEEIFTRDTITKRMPKILDSVLSKMPSDFKTPPVLEGVKRLQEEMRSDAQLKLLQSSSSRVGADSWNPHLSEFIERGEGWHRAPWWLVENYMYKRLLEAHDWPETKPA
eukprot:s1717_g12.t1